MIKRIVCLRIKDSDKKKLYPTVVELIKNNENLEISLPALYNALSKGKGKWENKRFTVSYQYQEVEPIEW